MRRGTVTPLTPHRRLVLPCAVFTLESAQRSATYKMANNSYLSFPLPMEKQWPQNEDCWFQALKHELTGVVSFSLGVVIEEVTELFYSYI